MSSDWPSDDGYIHDDSLGARTFMESASSALTKNSPPNQLEDISELSINGDALADRVPASGERPGPPAGNSARGSKAALDTSMPPLRGWRSVVKTVSAGQIPIGPSARDIAHHRQRRNVKSAFAGRFKIAVLALTDNIGLTTAAIGAASITSQIRGPRTLVLDMKSGYTNTLERFPETPDARSWQDVIDTSQRRRMTSAELDEYMVKNEQNLALLAKPDTLHCPPEASVAALSKILSITEEVYRIFYILCPTDPNAETTKAILDRSDAILTATTDNPRDLAKTHTLYEWLTTNGYANQTERTCLVINETHKQRRKRIAATNDNLKSLAWKQTVRIGFDSKIGGNAAMNIDSVDKRTRKSYLEIASRLSEWY